MKFLVDNALSPAIAAGLVAGGYDSIHVREIGLATASDQTILQHAEQEERIIVSADTDFGTLLTLHKTHKPSFILFRRTDKRPQAQLAFLLDQIHSLEADLERGCIVVFEDERIRIRSLPIQR